MKLSKVFVAFIVVASVSMFERTTFAQLAPPYSDPEIAKQESKLFASLNQAEMVFKAKVADVAYGPVASSFPPIYYMTMSFKDEEFFRGKKPEMMTFSYHIRQKAKPEFDRDKMMLVAANRSANRSSGIQITLIVPSDDRKLHIAKNAVSMPLGWQYLIGTPASPWARIKGWRWPKTTDLNAMIKCTVTGRPALLAGDGIAVAVEQIIPEDAHEFQNPYGDGRFKVTITNTSKDAVEVPALLSDGEEILWANSLVLIDHGQPRILPTAKTLNKVQAVTLGPNKSVSGEIDLLGIDGVKWPRGGSRIYFQFCLGEKSAQNFFYYFSRRHDKLRDAALKKVSEK